MRIVIQRVTRASVSLDNGLTAAIGPGLVLLVGVAKGDSPADADYLAGKIADLRIFADRDGKMNLGLRETGGAVLIVSNFTLYGDSRKGKRPSFDRAAPPEEARPIYDYFVERMKSYELTVATGVFQAHMVVSLENAGPVTLICESR
jgi:D-tyrosyl-tRNA(Tyr) deacylase